MGTRTYRAYWGAFDATSRYASTPSCVRNTAGAVIGECTTNANHWGADLEAQFANNGILVFDSAAMTLQLAPPHFDSSDGSNLNEIVGTHTITIAVFNSADFGEFPAVDHVVLTVTVTAD